MINSHYIPQFILRNFCYDNKLIYCDLDKKKAEMRNTRSVFSEKGYYPEWLEMELCKKIEYEFSVLYHNKLVNINNTLYLSEDEEFKIKKYLIVSALRHRYEYSDLDLQIIEKLGDSFKADLNNNLKNVLSAKSINDLVKIVESTEKTGFPYKMLLGEKINDKDINIHLWSEVRDILFAYNVFVRASKEEMFVIPDTSRGIFEGPMSNRKLECVIENIFKNRNPIIYELGHTLSPRDYSVFPLTKDIAILSMSSFFKCFTDYKYKKSIILPEDCPSVSEMLGFGSKKVIEPPKVRFQEGQKMYMYSVNQLNTDDISILNCIMMAQAKHFVAFSEVNDIRKSLEMAKVLSERDFDYVFDLQK